MPSGRLAGAELNPLLASPFVRGRWVEVRSRTRHSPRLHPFGEGESGGGHCGSLTTGQGPPILFANRWPEPYP
jgi:hypothetical protein